MRSLPVGRRRGKLRDLQSGVHTFLYLEKCPFGCLCWELPNECRLHQGSGWWNQLNPDGGHAVIIQAECHNTRFSPPMVLCFFGKDCQSELITKTCVIYKSILTLTGLCRVTRLYIPSCEEWAFFTGRSLSLLNGFCRFLPVSSAYPRVSQTALRTAA